MTLFFFEAPLFVVQFFYCVGGRDGVEFTTEMIDFSPIIYICFVCMVCQSYLVLKGLWYTPGEVLLPVRNRAFLEADPTPPPGWGSSPAGRLDTPPRVVKKGPSPDTTTSIVHLIRSNFMIVAIGTIATIETSCDPVFQPAPKLRKLRKALLMLDSRTSGCHISQKGGGRRQVEDSCPRPLCLRGVCWLEIPKQPSQWSITAQAHVKHSSQK